MSGNAFPYADDSLRLSRQIVKQSFINLGEQLPILSK